jgi:hypothetical protein
MIKTNNRNLQSPPIMFNSTTIQPSISPLSNGTSSLIPLSNDIYNSYQYNNNNSNNNINQNSTPYYSSSSSALLSPYSNNNNNNNNIPHDANNNINNNNNTSTSSSLSSPASTASSSSAALLSNSPLNYYQQQQQHQQQQQQHQNIIDNQKYYQQLYQTQGYQFQIGDNINTAPPIYESTTSGIKTSTNHQLQTNNFSLQPYLTPPQSAQSSLNMNDSIGNGMFLS